MDKSMKQYSQDAVNTALRTDPCDRETAEKAITTMYRKQGLRDPEFVWLDSFKQCALSDEFFSPTVTFDPISQLPEAMAEVCDHLPVEIAELNEMANWIYDRTNRLDNILYQRMFPDVHKEVTFAQSILSNYYSGTSRMEYVWGSVLKFLEDNYGFHYDGEFAEDIALWYAVGKSAHFMYPRREFCLMSERPEIFQVSDIHAAPEVIRLTAEDSPSIKLPDGTTYWDIDGVMVYENIVMRPEEQTIPEIDAEENEEVKRIRIERFGWNRYLTETNAEVIDSQNNDIENTKEYLLTRSGVSVLMCHCPSTARIYHLPVPANIKTCAEAQEWLWNSNQSRYKKARIIGRS